MFMVMITDNTFSNLNVARTIQITEDTFPSIVNSIQRNNFIDINAFSSGAAIYLNEIPAITLISNIFNRTSAIGFKGGAIYL